MGRFGVPIFVEFREATREFDIGFRVLEIVTAIAEVRFEVSPILRLARPRELFTLARSRLRKAASSMPARFTAMIAIVSGKLLSTYKLKSDGTSLRQTGADGGLKQLPLIPGFDGNRFCRIHLAVTEHHDSGQSKNTTS